MRSLATTGIEPQTSNAADLELVKKFMVDIEAAEKACAAKTKK